MVDVRNDGSGQERAVPSPKCPFDPNEQSEPFKAWQEGLGAGIHFVSEIVAHERESEAENG